MQYLSRKKTKQLLLQKKKRTNERNRIRGCFLLKMIEIIEPRYDNNFLWDTFLKKFLNSSKPNMWGAFFFFFLKGDKITQTHLARQK